MKATDRHGRLLPIPQCLILVPNGRGFHEIKMRVLPDISDSKSASYQDEPVIGRSFPIKTYSHSENRVVNMKVHFLVVTNQDIDNNLKDLRALQSATYPREEVNGPYIPPPICKIKCGKLLAGRATDGFLCAVLRQYQVTYPTDVAWAADQTGEGNYIPYKFDMDLTWEIVYPNEDLPGQEKIIRDL